MYTLRPLSKRKGSEHNPLERGESSKVMPTRQMKISSKLSLEWLRQYCRVLNCARFGLNSVVASNKYTNCKVCVSYSRAFSYSTSTSTFQQCSCNHCLMIISIHLLTRNKETSLSKSRIRNLLYSYSAQQWVHTVWCQYIFVGRFRKYSATICAVVHQILCKSKFLILKKKNENM
jgi:hypothetical protein